MITETNSIKILLIDDNEADYILTRNHLASQSDYNFELQWKNSVESALEYIQNNNGDFDICLMDYNIGAENGVDLAKKVRSLGFKSPIILYSGMQEQYIRNAHETQNVIEGFLSKTDISAELIVRQMEDAIEHRVEQFQKWTAGVPMIEQPEDMLESAPDVVEPMSISEISDNLALSILENFPDPIMALDETGTVTMVNQIFADLMCLKPSEILGSNATLFMNCSFDEFKSNLELPRSRRMSTKIKLNNNQGKKYIKWTVNCVDNNNKDIAYVAKGSLNSRSKRKKSILKSTLSLPFKWIPSPSYYKANNMYFRRDSFE